MSRRSGVARRLWLRLGLGTAIALASLVAVSPERPRLRVPPLPALSVGAAAGLLLYVLVARRRPVSPGTARPPLAVLACLLLGVAAAGEELVWRRAILGELLRAGPALALAGSSLAFAFAHRARTGLHFGTGAVFGGVYLVTGALGACIAAHWTYNVLQLWLADRRRLASGAPP